VKDGSGALYCFAESNLMLQIAFCKAIKAGVNSLTLSRLGFLDEARQGRAQIIMPLLTASRSKNMFFKDKQPY
jgi:hypothetical protein